MLKTEAKEKLIGNFQQHDTDTGSAEVQIALLSEEIQKILGHLKKNPKDQHSRRGLLKMVIKRRKLLKFLEQDNKRKYNAIIKKLGLKK
ncbi:MAG: 30S ribosomal protein S15 [Candidatus Gribaldobacteria bacterium]|nr:30S ribosomal protein S15 [Candidatus Gribaldobacteria bacterium]